MSISSFSPSAMAKRGAKCRDRGQITHPKAGEQFSENGIPRENSQQSVVLIICLSFSRPVTIKIMGKPAIKLMEQRLCRVLLRRAASQFILRNPHPSVYVFVSFFKKS